MNNTYLLEPTDDSATLSDYSNQYLQLSFKEQTEVNAICLEMYGVNIVDFYKQMQNSIANDMKSYFHESAHRINSTFQRAMTLRKLYDKKEQGLSIITPSIIENSPKYLNEGKLDEVYHEYLNLEFEKKELSNQISLEYFGHTVDQMYQLEKQRIFAENGLECKTLYALNDNEKILSVYTEYVKDEGNHVDRLRRHIRMLECLTYKGRLLENTILESVCSELDDLNNTMVDYAEDIPTITPYFTPDEMRDDYDIEVDPYEYIFQGNKSAKLHEMIRNKMFHHYLDEDNDNLNNSIIKSGWNPNVPYSESSINYAKERQLNWLNKNKRVNIVDISKLPINEKVDDKPVDTDLEPIYITLLSHEGINSKIIRGWTNSNYSHAGLSFDPSMTKIYSFNAATPDGQSGLSIESIEFYKKAKGAKFKVLVFFVQAKVKNKLLQVVNFYMKNKDKISYSYMSIFNLVMNKTKDTSLSLSLICSQFVDVILKAVNIDLSGKPSNLVTPGDFDRVSNNSTTIFDLFHDFVEKYKPSTIKRKVKSLMVSKQFVVVKPVTECLDFLYDNYCDTIVKTENIKVDKILKEVSNMLTANAIIIEAKPLPVRFNKTGNLYIDLPRDLEMEYQESHKLLTAYTEDNLEGIKHELARLFYINSIIERKIKKMNKADDEYKKLIDLRARVLNDYKKYLSVILKAEKEFDFETYMRNSEYYNKTIVVDKHTLKYTGATIKELIKLMV